jgi:hypothetical protein
MKKPKLPKKGAGRRLSERLTNLSKQPPPQSLVDKINADQDGATKEQKAQDWVVANVDSAPDTPSFEEVWIAGYEQGDRDAVERSMTHIEKQGVALANLEHKLLVKTTKGEAFTKKEVYKIIQSERERDYTAIMDLFFALREINGTPTLKDLVKLAKRIKRTKPSFRNRE